MKHRSVFIAALATAEALCMAPCMATAEGNPFQFSAHGAVYGTDGQVAATPAFVQLAISHELAELLARASPSQRNQFEDKRRHAASLTRGDAQAGLYTQTLLLDWLLRQVQAADSAEIAGRNRALQRLLRWRPGEALRAWLAQADL